MTFTAPIFTKLAYDPRWNVDIYAKFAQNRWTNVEITGRRSFTPKRKLWLLPRQFSPNSYLLNHFLWHRISWKSDVILGRWFWGTNRLGLHRRRFFFHFVKKAQKDPGSPVDIVPTQRAGRPGFESQYIQFFLFSKTFRPALRPTQPVYSISTGIFCRGLKTAGASSWPLTYT